MLFDPIEKSTNTSSRLELMFDRRWPSFDWIVHSLESDSFQCITCITKLQFNQLTIEFGSTDGSNGLVEWFSLRVQFGGFN